MSDYYFLKIKCAYCDKENYPDNSEMGMSPGIYYSNTSKTFRCEFCGEENHIQINFKAVKQEKITSN